MIHILWLSFNYDKLIKRIELWMKNKSNHSHTDPTKSTDAGTCNTVPFSTISVNPTSMLLIPCYVNSPLGDITDNQRAINWSVYLFFYLRHIFKITVVTSHSELPPYTSNYPDYVNLKAKNTNTTQGEKKKLYSMANVHAKSWLWSKYIRNDSKLYIHIFI